jgi:hypothetical protein
MPKANTSMDEGFVEVKAGSSFKFGAPGDYIKGTYRGFSMFDGVYGPTKSHKIEAEDGVYHEIDKDSMQPVGEAIAVTPGSLCSILEKPIFADKIAQAKEGQRVIIRFEDLRKSKSNGKNYKNIVVKLDASFKPQADVPFM